MSEVVHNPQQEFWRPPVQSVDAQPVMVEACDQCGTEFMAAAGFCHVCGAARQAHANPGVQTSSWEFLRVLEFQSVKRWLGLPMGSLIAFFAGLGCLVGALAVGAIYTVQNFSDFQAIQLWRMQWLLAAVAAFVAGILLKTAGTQQK